MTSKTASLIQKLGASVMISGALLCGASAPARHADLVAATAHPSTTAKVATVRPGYSHHWAAAVPSATAKVAAIRPGYSHHWAAVVPSATTKVATARPGYSHHWAAAASGAIMVADIDPTIYRHSC